MTAAYSTSSSRPHPWAAKQARDIITDALSKPGTNDPNVLTSRIITALDDAHLVIVPVPDPRRSA